MSKLIFLPFFYLFYTRLESKTSKIGWLFTYVFPLFITGSLLNVDLIFLVLLIFVIYSTYEIGYIYNDCELIKKETNPTIRLNGSDFSFYEKNKLMIYTFRFLVLVFQTAIAYCFYVEYVEELVFLQAIILFFYYVYNKNRSDINLPIYMFLIYSRYFLFFIFLHPDFILFLIFLLIYPLEKIIEFATKPRFSISRYISISDFNLFRAKYYSVILTISCVSYFFVEHYYSVFIILSLYFFLYRWAIFLKGKV